MQPENVEELRFGHWRTRSANIRLPFFSRSSFYWAVFTARWPLFALLHRSTEFWHISRSQYRCFFVFFVIVITSLQKKVLSARAQGKCKDLWRPMFDYLLLYPYQKSPMLRRIIHFRVWVMRIFTTVHYIKEMLWLPFNFSYLCFRFQ